jgi:hypothetical protein
MANLERGWRGLSKAAVIKTSPLVGMEKKNLRITASAKAIKEHLKHVASRMGTRWGFLVISDATMMDAWLSKGIARIYDADVEEMRSSDSRGGFEKSPYDALSELVEHPPLLIVVLGVKAARNSAMAEVLLEALTLRDFAGRPTWLVDQPVHPFAEGHLSWSSSVESWLEPWEKVVLSRPALTPSTSTVIRPGKPQTFVMGREPIVQLSEPPAVTWEQAELTKMKESDKKKWRKRKGKQE